jgi:shikimate kinase
MDTRRGLCADTSLSSPVMRRVLLTGMSGTGKSALVLELNARGHRAVDLDSPEYSEWIEVDDPAATAGSPVEPGRDWVWREDRVAELLARDDGDLLVVSGCAANMGRFLPCFDDVVLLRAPVDVIVSRLAARPPGDYGSRPDQAQRVVALVDTVEPLLRRAADHEVDSSGALEDTLAAVLEIALPPRS